LAPGGMAALGAFWLARILGARPAGCAISALSYSLSGYVTSQVSNVTYAWSSGALAVLVALFVRAARRGWSPGTFAATVLTSASTAWIGELQGFGVFTLVAAALGLFLAPDDSRRKYVAGAALAIAVILGLAAPQL